MRALCLRLRDGCPLTRRLQRASTPPPEPPAGVNDTLEDAARLAALTARVECKINLILFNSYSGTAFKPSDMAAVKAFRAVLIQAGRVATIRDSRGGEEMAACGQLGTGPAAERGGGPLLEPPERFRHLFPGA